jgi:hypothetical protein
VLWVGDITYVRTWEGWLYLATVLDVFAPRVIGWALAGREGAAGGARLSQAHSGFSDHCLVDRRPPPCGVTVSDQSPPAAAART